MHIAIIWQRFLPYHVACINHLHKKCLTLGYKLTAIEVASQDYSYRFPENKFKNMDFKHICCFPGISYHQCKANEIHKKVLSVLVNLRPDLVFAPATPFPEGMAAYAYRLSLYKKAVMMDDAWEHTDRRGMFTKEIKRLIHQNIDAAFVPAPTHLSYYVKIGFPKERVYFGVYAIDNNYFSEISEHARANEKDIRISMQLPENYFLFVGRFLPKKGLETLIKAYQKYRTKVTQKPWFLILVGGGSQFDYIYNKAKEIPGILFPGPKFGDDLCRYYSFARALIVPSILDQWGLVVNEALASGLPVIVSRGCGAARTLVKEGENGWTFEPESIEELADLMSKMSSLPDSALQEMGQASRQIVAQWGLDRFVDGALAALEIPRRPNAGFLANLLTRLWKGRVRLN